MQHAIRHDEDSSYLAIPKIGPLKKGDDGFRFTKNPRLIWAFPNKREAMLKRAEFIRDGWEHFKETDVVPL